MLAELFFNRAINEYVASATSDEHPILKHCRTETRTQTKMIEMLSGPVEGQLLQFLIRLSKAQSILEVGTFTGYASLNMAQALPADGKLVTLEYNAEYAAIAQKFFDLSPWKHKIQLQLGKAAELIPTLQQTFDVVFIDADKSNYPLYYDLAVPMLNQGGLIIVDNALWDGHVVAPKNNQTKAIDALNRKAKDDPRVETVMLTVRDGILLAQKR